MLPKIHFLIGLFVALVLFFIFPALEIIPILVFFLSSFLIDFDHYLYFIIKEKSFNLKKAYFWFRERGKRLRKIPKNERKNYSTGTYIFHGVEPLVLVILLGISVHKYFFWVAAGMALHLIFDWIEKFGISLVYPKKISVIYDLRKDLNLKSV